MAFLVIEYMNTEYTWIHEYLNTRIIDKTDLFE